MSTGDAVSETLEFYAFPPVNPAAGTQTDLSEPCSQVQTGEPCNTFGNHSMSITWKTSPAVIQYSSRSLTPIPFPLAYLPYVSLAYFDTDDEGVYCNKDQFVFEDSNGKGGFCACAGCSYVKKDSNSCASGGSAPPLPECPLQCTRGGMHTTNGGNYQDSTCPGGILGRAKSSIITDSCGSKVGGRTISAMIWCAHQTGNPFEVSFETTSGHTSEAVPKSGTTRSSPFVSVLGPCNQYQNTRCIPAEADDDTDDDDGCHSHAIQGLCCDWQRDGGTCGSDKSSSIQAVAGANLPLRGDYLPNPANTNSGPCVTCPASYSDGRYMAGLWGFQRKCYSLMEDWTDSYAVAMRIPYSGEDAVTAPVLDPDDPQDAGRGGGLSTWTITNPATGTTQEIPLSQQFSSEFLATCFPGDTGDTCWSSYNRPQDFVVQSTKPGIPPDPTINSQGVEGTLANDRGPSMTPWWPSGTGSTDNGEVEATLVRCGHHCADMPSSSLGGNLNRTTLNAGYVKGMAAVGPFCKAYEVSLQGAVLATITFDIEFTQTDGTRASREIVLSTTSVGQGSSVAYSSAGNGVTARINGVKSASGSASTLLGGVLVTCGTSIGTMAGNAAGILNGQLGPGTQLTTNPWDTLTRALQAVEQLRAQQGGSASPYTSTGVQDGGCAVPIPPFISALQCFSCATFCTAPWDICGMLQQVCSNPKYGLDCNVPIDPQSLQGQSTSGTFTCREPGPFQNKILNCARPTEGRGGSVASDNKAAAWYWLPRSSQKAFGTGCGQYGLDYRTFGQSSDEARYICESPGATVRCVPGFSAGIPSEGVKGPCEMVGGLVKFHGQTSRVQSQTARVASTCFTTEQLAINPLGPGSQGGCDNLGGSKATPPPGLPRSWNVGNPNWWVHGTNMYTTPNDDTQLTLDVTLYVNGEALNAETSTISPGHFIAPLGNFSCRLQKGDDTGSVPIAVQNTGTLDANYVVTFRGCSGSGSDVTQAPGFVPPVIGLEAGKNNSANPIQFALVAPAGASYDAASCSFSLSPEFYSVDTAILDQASYSCVLGSVLDNLNAAATGIDNAQLPEPASTCQSADIWCILFTNDNIFGRVLFWTLIGVILVFAIWFIVAMVKALYAEGKIQTELGRANNLRVEAQKIETQKRVEEEVEAQQLSEKISEKRDEKRREAMDAMVSSIVGGVSSVPLTPE